MVVVGACSVSVWYLCVRMVCVCVCAYGVCVRACVVWRGCVRVRLCGV